MGLITNVLLLEHHITLPSLRKSAHQGTAHGRLQPVRQIFVQARHQTRNLGDAISELHISPKSSFFGYNVQEQFKLSGRFDFPCRNYG